MGACNSKLQKVQSSKSPKPKSHGSRSRSPISSYGGLVQVPLWLPRPANYGQVGRIRVVEALEGFAGSANCESLADIGGRRLKRCLAVTLTSEINARVLYRHDGSSGFEDFSGDSWSAGIRTDLFARNGGSNPENWLGFGVALLQLSELPKAHAMSEFQTRDPILQDFVTGGGSAPMGASARSHKFWERLVPLGQALL